jgi:hypothetical protein
LKLLIGIVLENWDYNDMKNTLNMQHLVSTQEGAPWDSYYATLNGAEIAVSAYCRVWFEIEQQGDSWQAAQVAHLELNLVHDPLPGINWEELVKLGEPTNVEIVEASRASRLASRASQHNAPPH